MAASIKCDERPFKGGSGGALPPQPKTGGSGGQRPPAKNISKYFEKFRKNPRDHYFTNALLYYDTPLDSEFAEERSSVDDLKFERSGTGVVFEKIL